MIGLLVGLLLLSWIFRRTRVCSDVYLRQRISEDTSPPPRQLPTGTTWHSMSHTLRASPLVPTGPRSSTPGFDEGGDRPSTRLSCPILLTSRLAPAMNTLSASGSWGMGSISYYRFSYSYAPLTSRLR